LNLDDERLDQAIERFAGIVERLHARQDVLEHRLATLYQGVAIAFTTVSLRFRGLNRSVAGMGADVDQIARPIP